MDQNLFLTLPLLSNKITGFFDNQYRRKETISVVDFLHKGCNQD